MKKLKVKKGSTCMACLACVGACSEAFYKVFDPDKACLQIVEKKAVRPIACPQCGKCAEACPEGAITQNPKGVYMINKKKCTGCGACAKACPFGLIVKTEGKELPDRVFEEAGALAAYYSKGRGNEKVEVDYIQRKNLKKVPGAAPGFVVYHTNYSLMAVPGIPVQEVK